MAEPQANANTTDIDVPVVMHMEEVTGRGTTPTPAEKLAGEATPEPEAPVVDVDTAVQRVNDRRNAQMSEIARRRMEAMQREIRQGEEMADEAREAAGMPPREPEAKEAAAPEPERPVAPIPPSEPASAPDAAAPAKRKIKVYGQEIEVDPSQEHTLIQKGAAYDHLAREVAQLRQAVQIQAPRQAEPAPAPASQPTAPVIGIDDQLAAIQRRISYGTDEEQKTALAEYGTLIAQRTAEQIQKQQPEVTPERIVQVATQQAKAEIQFERNLETIGQEFPDLFADEDLTLLAARKVGSLRTAYQQAGIQKSDLDLYREAARHTADRYLKPSAAPPAPSAQPQPPAQAAPPPAQSRLERKRAAPQPPAAASQRAPTSPDTYSAPSPKAIVAAMRKARHQPAMD